MKHIVGLSGGIDSQAAAKWARNRFAAADVLMLNSQAGRNELALTTNHVLWYSENVFPVTEVVPLVRDIWEDANKPAEYGLEPDAELTFELLATIKGRFPSRRMQFCTENLKLKPMRRWVRENLPDQEIEWYTGVRRDESEWRKNTPFREWSDFHDAWINNPLADWTKDMCFSYVRDEKVNPLYKLGFGRVGCKCVNSLKEDVRALADRFPEEITAIREMEARTGKTYFAPCVPGVTLNWIDEVVEWSRTDRGGRQFNIFNNLERPACESKFGLCE